MFDDVGNPSADCRPVAIDNDETIDVALTVSLASSDAPEDNDTEKVVDIVGVSDCGLHAVNEGPDRCMELRLWNGENRVITLDTR